MVRMSGTSRASRIASDHETYIGNEFQYKISRATRTIQTKIQILKTIDIDGINRIIKWRPTEQEL